jgi:hypothetical protein
VRGRGVRTEKSGHGGSRNRPRWFPIRAMPVCMPSSQDFTQASHKAVFEPPDFERPSNWLLARSGQWLPCKFAREGEGKTPWTPPSTAPADGSGSSP